MAVVWILLACVVVVTVVSIAQYRAARGVYVPLSQRKPGAIDPAQPAERDVPLGMEALDLKEVARTARRNDALERSGSLGHGRMLSHNINTAADGIDPLPDDETYAKRFHTAFIKDKTED